MVSQAQRRAQTRSKIIKAAKKLFDKQGFEDTSVDQIVKTADVAKGTFYQYYETKIDVLADVARDEGAEKMRQGLEAVANGAPALAMLERYIKGQCEWFEAHENVAEALILGALRTVGEEKPEDEHRYSRIFLAKLMKLAQDQGVIRQDVDPKDVAKVIGGALVVSVLSWSKQPVPGVLLPSMQRTLDIVLHGVKTGS